MINNPGLIKYLSIFALSFFPLPVLAYLDPGTGSLIIQSLLAAIAAAFVALNHYWDKVKSMFKRKQHDENENKPE